MMLQTQAATFAAGHDRDAGRAGECPIDIRGLNLSYKGKPVLRDVSLNVPPGAVLGLLFVVPGVLYAWAMRRWLPGVCAGCA